MEILENRDKTNIDPKTNTDTFFALKTFIQNDRFKDVPIYIRAGKKLKCKYYFLPHRQYRSNEKPQINYNKAPHSDVPNKKKSI